jgi:hypothetical protein
MLRVIREQPQWCLHHLCAPTSTGFRELQLITAVTNLKSDDSDYRVALEVAADILGEWDAGRIVAGQMTLPLE